MDWILLLLVIWGVSMVVGRRGGCAFRGRGRYRWLDETESTASTSGSVRDELAQARWSGRGALTARRDAVRTRRSGAGARARAATALAETPMESLQRRFVDGSLTVEEYERELDRLLRKG